jgi:hypothetical protein
MGFRLGKVPAPAATTGEHFRWGREQGTSQQRLPHVAESMSSTGVRKVRFDLPNNRVGCETPYSGSRAITALIWPQVTIEGFGREGELQHYE